MYRMCLVVNNRCYYEEVLWMTKTKDLNKRDEKVKEKLMKQIELILTIFPGVVLHHLI